MTERNKSKDFKSTEFLKLKTKWYKKLEKSGFEDIEHDEKNLKSHSGKWSITDENGNNKIDTWNRSGLISSVGEHNKYNYYLKCRQFLNDYEFSNKIDKKIFEMHSEGKGIRVIAVKLKTYRLKIHTILKRLIKEMRAKYG